MFKKIYIIMARRKLNFWTTPLNCTWKTEEMLEIIARVVTKSLNSRLIKLCLLEELFSNFWFDQVAFVEGNVWHNFVKYHWPWSRFLCLLHSENLLNEDNLHIWFGKHYWNWYGRLVPVHKKKCLLYILSKTLR